MFHSDTVVEYGLIKPWLVVTADTDCPAVWDFSPKFIDGLLTVDCTDYGLFWCLNSKLQFLESHHLLRMDGHRDSSIRLGLGMWKL